MIVQKTNGLWCDDKALKFKMAKFGKKYDLKPRSVQVPQIRKAMDDNHTHNVGYQRNRSFAEVVRGRGVPTTTTKTIKVRMGGRRDMVLSFKSVKAMKENFLKMQDWLNEWCESVLEWRQGIGKNWGVVIAIDDDTLRLNLLHYSKCASHPTEWKNGRKTSLETIADDQITNKNRRHEEKDDDIEIQMGEKSDLRCGVAGVGTNVSPAIADELDRDERRRVDGEVYTPSFIKSLSGSEGNKVRIQIEVDLNRTQMAGGLVRGIGRPEKRRKIKKSIADRKVDIVLLQETKKAVVDSDLVRALLSGAHFDFMVVDVVGQARGLLLNGSMIEEPLEIRDVIKAHFMRKFYEDWKDRPKLVGPFKSIGGAQVVGSNGLRVTHLQFADDTILFCDADRMEVSNIKRILKCFEISSEFASNLNCLHQKLPLKYLGLPFGASPSSRSTWKPVLDKRLLSFAGRLTLIKSIMSNLPLYYLSMFRILAGWCADPSELFIVSSVYNWCESLLGFAVTMAANLEQFCSFQNATLWVAGLACVCWVEFMAAGSLVCFLSAATAKVYTTKRAYSFPGQSLGPPPNGTYVYGTGASPPSYLDGSNFSGSRKARHQNNWELSFRRPLLAWKEDELQKLRVVLGEGPALRLESNDMLWWKADPSGSAWEATGCKSWFRFYSVGLLCSVVDCYADMFRLPYYANVVVVVLLFPWLVAHQLWRY
ncbi:hypothetical protein CsSME_00028347 [Camellia sinensis var. sinensis]